MTAQPSTRRSARSSRVSQGVRAIVDDLARRSQRGRLDRLTGDGVVGVVLAWLAGAPLAWAVLIGVTLAPLGDLVDGSIVVGIAPAWVRIIVYLAVAAATVAGVIAATARLASHRPASVVSAVVVLAVCVGAGVCATAGLVARAQTLAALWATGCLVVGGVGAAVVLIATVARRRALHWSPTAAASIVLAAPWVLLACGTSGLMDDAQVDPVWITVSSIVVSAACVAAFYGFSTAGSSRVAAMRAGTARVRGLGTATAVAVAAIALIVVRFTIAQALFDGNTVSGDAALWSLRSPESWPLAAAIAGLVVWLAFRSEASPLRPDGLGWAIGALTAGGAYAFVAAGALAVLFLGEVAFGWDVTAAAQFVSCGPFDCVPVAGVLGAVAIAPMLFIARYRGTVGFAVALVGVPFVLAGTAAPLLVEATPSIPTFWATPSEVVLAIVLACAVIIVAQWFGRLRSFPVAVLIRLLVYPLVVLHAALLVPAVIGAGFAKPLAMGVILLSFVLLLPPVSADRRRQTAVVAGASVAALSAAIALLTPAHSEEWTALAQTSALLLLSIPVTVALVVRTRADAGDDDVPRRHPPERQRYSGSKDPAAP